MTKEARKNEQSKDKDKNNHYKNESIMDFFRKKRELRLLLNELIPPTTIKDVFLGRINPERLIRKKLADLNSEEDQIKELLVKKNKEPLSEEEQKIINTYFNTLKKINILVGKINELELNLPKISASFLTEIKAQAISIPVQALSISVKRLKIIKENLRAFFSRENSNDIENIITQEFFEEIISEIASSESFIEAEFQKKILFPDPEDKKIINELKILYPQMKDIDLYNQLRIRIKNDILNTEKRDIFSILHKNLSQSFITTREIYSQIQSSYGQNNLNTEISSLSDLLDDPLLFLEKIDKLFFLNQKNIIPDKLLFSLKAKLENAIEKHSIITSLLNMKFSYWRRYAFLNLDTIKTTIKKLSPEVMNAITFDETMVLHSEIDADKIDSETTNVLNNIFETAVTESLKYGKVKFSPSGPLAKFNLPSFFTMFNRGLVNGLDSKLYDSDKRIILPRKTFAIIRGDIKSQDYKVELSRYGEFQDIGLQNMLELMLNDWVKMDGNLDKVKVKWMKELKNEDYEKIINKYSNGRNIEELIEHLLSKVCTLPIIILPTDVLKAEQLSDMQVELTEKLNSLRLRFSTSSMIITYGYNNKGDLAVAASADHVAWDGKQTAQYVSEITQRFTKKIKEIEISNESQIKLTTNDIALNQVVPDKEFLEDQHGNYPLQIFVESDGISRFSTDIAFQVRSLVAEGKIDKDSKMKNPAVIEQMILMYEYKKILHLDKYEEIGMLTGNDEITSNLDLASLKSGFNLELFLELDKDQQTEYLQLRANELSIASKNTNLELVKKTVESISNPKMQIALNSVSRISPLWDGLSHLAGPYMMSSFGLPKINPKTNEFETPDFIRMAGPAMADYQNTAVTFVSHTICFDILRQKNILAKSVRIKSNDNSKTVEIAHGFINSINRYNGLYERYKQA